MSALWSNLSFSPTSLSFPILLLLSSLPALTTIGHRTCALYEPPIPGITCFYDGQQEVLPSLTNSPTAWMLEMYSSWCGHCQRFAPLLKELGKEIQPWEGVFRIGVMECNKNNNDVCGQMEVQAYPTIRVRSPSPPYYLVLMMTTFFFKFFKPFDPKPRDFKSTIVGECIWTSSKILLCTLWCPP